MPTQSEHCSDNFNNNLFKNIFPNEIHRHSEIIFSIICQGNVSFIFMRDVFFLVFAVFYFDIIVVAKILFILIPLLSSLTLILLCFMLLCDH
jgi:hypothetical protein